MWTANNHTDETKTIINISPSVHDKIQKRNFIKCGRKSNEATIFIITLCSGGASFFEWGGQRGANTFSGGKCIWLPITHFHNTGHILNYSKYPSLSFDLSLLFASCGSFPFHLSFISISRPSLLWYSYGSGERCKLPPAGPGGARPPNGIWWILGLEMSVF